MGYFSNGTEGQMYEERYCSKCVHETTIGKDGVPQCCAVWASHVMFNYDECNNSKSILDELIPRHGVVNEQCKMFYEVPAPKYDPRQNVLPGMFSG